MLNRSFNAVLVRLAIVAAALALLVLAAPGASADSHATTISYAENGTDPVATFDATDADGDAIVWDLEGEDAAAFKISASGVLTFDGSPSFEDPTDNREDNVYKVTVTASGGSIDVEVTVTDVDEPGSPSLDKPQPQVGRGLVASGPDDPDEPVTDVLWQWSRGPSAEGPWENIGNPAGSGSRNPTDDDIGMYLRATAMYTDKFGSDKTASKVSESTVEERTTSNARPSFDDHEDSNAVTPGLQIARDVDENKKGAAVGKPISATDDDDVLVYTLGANVANEDVDETTLFDIDSRTGQLTTKIALDSNSGDDANDTDTEEDTYTVLVTVTDPSGADATVAVVITVNNVNDAPAFGEDAPGALWVTEGTAGAQLRTTEADGNPLDVGAYAATDDDTADTDRTYAVSGADKDSFDISPDAGVLTVKAEHTPDYEGQKTYSITLMVEDDEFALGTHEVTVTVVNAEDLGTVSYNAREPQIGKAVLATLTDEDGNIRIKSWQWQRAGTALQSDDGDGGLVLCSTYDAAWTDIAGQTGPSYEPTAADIPGDENDETNDRRCIRAMVSYTDGFVTVTDLDDGTDVGDTAGDTVTEATERAVQAGDPANTAPEFPKDNDPNTPGDQAVAEREVPENKTTTVGAPVRAEDVDLLLYSISDTANFSVTDDGQISTEVRLDYEALPDDAKYYMVMLTATDPSGASGSIMVKITVLNGPDNAVITGTKTFTYPENGTDAVATFSATDADGDAIVWDLEGKDAAAFKISASGVLTFDGSPSFELPTDNREDNVYKVTVTASGGTLDLVVTVTDVDEDGKPEFDKPQPQVGRGLVASGPDDPDEPVTDVLWQWSRGSSAEGPWENIGNPASSSSRNPTDDDIGKFLRATAMYTDKFGSGKTASVVSENPVEARTLANARPSFDDHEDSNAVTPGLQIARDVDENKKGAAVGKPISATDDDDVLVYTLGANVANEDVDETTLFDIDSRTGQLTTKIALDSNSGDDANDTDTEEDTYTVLVTVTDPSGADATVAVVITVNNVNDAPAFVSTETDNLKAITVAENVTGTDLLLETYDATDDDALDDVTDAQLTYILDGADKDSFTIGNGVDGADDRGALTLKSSPNYEKKKTYSITVMAEDDEFALGEVDVTVTVTNVEDPGTVSYNAREPQIGKAVLATLTDEDGNIRIKSWQWQRAGTALQSDDGDGGLVLCSTSTDTENWTPIVGQTGPSYEPTAADIVDDENDETNDRRCIRAMVSYTDGFVTVTDLDDGTDVGDTAGDTVTEATERAVQAGDPANTAPKFPDDNDPNTPGDQAVAEREVPENKTTTVGAPVRAEDVDLLMYSISDSTNFSVTDDGQISTEVKLDYEALPEDAKYYMVMLTATDPSGAFDTIMVKITVLDGPDNATIKLANNAPAFDLAMVEFMVDENMPMGTDVGMVMATDEDGDPLTYSVESMYFDIDEMSGQITTAMSLDHEAMSSHTVTVTADDSQDKDNTATIMVTIAVTDVPEGACAGGAAVADMTNKGLLADCDALLNIMGDLVGDGPGLDWSVDTPVDDWQGVAAGSGRVTGIFLADIGLAGTIPAEISGLSALKGLTLRDNDLIGEIPDLSALDNLEVLNLKGNSLSGSIPATLGDMASIDKLWLYSNDLTGTIPAELSRATTLRQIRLNDNGLTGEIPSELGHLPRLRYLVLSRNSLTGGIPSDLGNAVNMKQLYLYSNMLTGEIPASLGDMVDADGESVRRLQLHDNTLSGDVPASLGNLVSLENWRLGGNMLTGCIPMTLAGVSDSDMAATGLMACTDDGS